jgi:hypothetical protein
LAKKIKPIWTLASIEVKYKSIAQYQSMYLMDNLMHWSFHGWGSAPLTFSSFTFSSLGWFCCLLTAFRTDFLHNGQFRFIYNHLLIQLLWKICLHSSSMHSWPSEYVSWHTAQISPSGIIPISNLKKSNSLITPYERPFLFRTKMARNFVSS